MNEEEKLIKEQFDKLPSNLQQAISALPWKALVEEIGKSNALDPEQIVSLEQETMFVLYAFENPDDFVQNIIRAVSVSQETANKIGDSVAEKILGPIVEKSIGEKKVSGDNLPMVEEGEVAHSVPHVEPARTTEVVPRQNDFVGLESGGEPPKPKETKTSLPDYRYGEGKDPYREPLV
ncbi:MAG: hypothetical protein AAB719_01685 [Patescibacteria group bacterium]